MQDEKYLKLYTDAQWKAVKIGCDYLRDKDWKPKIMKREQCERLKISDPVLFSLGFIAQVFDGESYFRVSFSRP